MDKEIAEKIVSNPNGYTPDSVRVAQCYLTLLSEHAAYKKVVEAARICNDLVRQNSKDMKAIVVAGENLQQALDELPKE